MTMWNFYLLSRINFLARINKLLSIDGISPDRGSFIYSTSGLVYEFDKLAKPKYYIGFEYRDNLYCWYLNSGGLNYCNGDLINIQRVLPEYSSKSSAKRKLLNVINRLDEDMVEIRFVDLDNNKVEIIDTISKI